MRYNYLVLLFFKLSVEVLSQKLTFEIMIFTLIQTDHLISARRPDLVIINKKKKRTDRIVAFADAVKQRVKLKDSEKNDKFQELAIELKKTVEHERDGYTNCRWCSWYSHQRIGKMTRGLGNKRKSGDNPNYSIVEIGQTTEESPGDLRRLVVTQTPVKDHQLTLMWKTLKE